VWSPWGGYRADSGSGGGGHRGGGHRAGSGSGGVVGVTVHVAGLSSSDDRYSTAATDEEDVRRCSTREKNEVAL